MKLALAFLIAFLWSSSVQAQKDENEKRFLQYLASSEFRQQLAEAGVISDAYIELGCVDKSVQYQVKNIRGVNGIKLPIGATHPTAGIWRISYVAKRCGKEIQHNTWFKARAKGRPETIISVPGTTITDARLQFDLNGFLFATASQAADFKDCKQFKAINSNLISAPTKSKDKSGKQVTHWTETWTVRLCNQGIEIPIVFAQTEGTPGTSYVAKDHKKISSKEIDESKPLTMADFMSAMKKINASTNTASDLELMHHFAKTGFGEAQYFLAVTFLNGTKKIARDPLNVFYWAMHAALGGHAKAMHLVGSMYRAGIGITKDPYEALKWLKRSLKAGYKPAQKDIDSLALQGISG